MKPFTNLELAQLHDVVMEATSESYTVPVLLQMFDELPDYIKAEVEHWGLSDTPVQDSIFRHLKGQQK